QILTSLRWRSGWRPMVSTCRAAPSDPTSSRQSLRKWHSSLLLELREPPGMSPRRGANRCASAQRRFLHDVSGAHVALTLRVRPSKRGFHRLTLGVADDHFGLDGLVEDLQRDCRRCRRAGDDVLFITARYVVVY